MKKLLFIALCAFITFAAHAQVSDTVKTDTSKFVPVDQAPEFHGGMEKLFSFLKKNQRSIETEKSGRVTVTFVVEKDGSLTNIKVTKGLSEDADAEAIRLIKKMPKWDPGMQNNNPVRVQYSIPITFQ